MAAMISFDELGAILTLGQAMDWAGLDGDDTPQTPRGAFLNMLGATAATLPRNIGIVPEVDLETVIRRIQLAPVSENAARTNLNVTQLGACLLTARVCRMKAGIGAPSDAIRCRLMSAAS